MPAADPEHGRDLPDPTRLSPRDAAILAFEREWWSHAGAKETAIRERFGLSATRYYQVLGALIDSPDALVADPLTVKRLRRMREARLAARAARTFADRARPPLA